MTKIYESSDGGKTIREKTINQFCDNQCKHFRFSKEEWTGKRSCGTFNIVWCDQKKEHVQKNAICEFKEEEKK